MTIWVLDASIMLFATNYFITLIIVVLLIFFLISLGFLWIFVLLWVRKKLSSYIFWWSVCSNLLPIFQLGFLFSYYFVYSGCQSFIKYTLQMFSPTLWIAFYSLINSFKIQTLLILMMFNLSIFCFIDYLWCYI